MKPIILFILCELLAVSICMGQIAPTPAEKRLDAYKTRKDLLENSPVSALEAHSIGPSIFSCRVTDVEVDPADASRFYVAYASGGLWLTESNGTRFIPIFDDQAAMTIGDIAVNWKHNILWVGTGECNSSRSSYAGTGIYKSVDGGKSWQHMGLPESHHISRILLDPENPDVLWVAVLGHLYSPNAERGVYKSVDGGKSWQKTLFVDEMSGAIDLISDPQLPQVLYAASWQRTRSAWNFKGAGPGSAIWKSTDAGESWSLLSSKTSGFPNGEFAGRIGLCAGISAGKTVLYASIDNQTPNPSKPRLEGALNKDRLRSISKTDFLKLPNAQIEDYLKQNNFPEIYNANKIKNLIEKEDIKPSALVDYLEDANNNLFNTDYAGAEVYKSEDGGVSWVKTHAEPLKGIYFSYGYYFSNIRCMPNHPEELYLLGFLLIHSRDGGKTWENISGDNVHADHHALWVNPDRPGHLVNGNDGGVNISWDNGKSWIKCNNPAVGQFYAVAVDQADPFQVYGGAQDNGVWAGPSNYTPSDGWHQEGRYPYQFLLGGDGMQVAVDPRDNQTVFAGYQFGNYFRIDKKSGKATQIGPSHVLGERPLRFNWQTPIWLSVHNPDVLYLGANRLYRSFDQGNHWEALSPDLTKGGKPGNVPYGTLTTVHESPLKFGLLYTGSDDGLVFGSKDGGENWNNLSAQLPSDLWVSRVQASAHRKNRVYVSLNGYRWDDFNAYLYVSDDYGQNWTRLGLQMPAEPVNVFKEDPLNENLLYAGTDHGLYVSIDRGVHFYPIGNGFPHTPVHDLAVQAQTGTLVIGTHGRSLYKMDVSGLQQLHLSDTMPILTLFQPQKVPFSRTWGNRERWSSPDSVFALVSYFANASGKVQWTLKSNTGLPLNGGTLTCKKGLNTFTFDLSIAENQLGAYEKMIQTERKDFKHKKADNGKYYLLKGVYTLEFTMGEKVRAETKLTVE